MNRMQSLVCHDMNTHFDNFGTNILVYELDNGPVGKVMERALSRLLGCKFEVN